MKFIDTTYVIALCLVCMVFALFQHGNYWEDVIGDMICSMLFAIVIEVCCQLEPWTKVQVQKLKQKWSNRA